MKLLIGVVFQVYITSPKDEKELRDALIIDIDIKKAIAKCKLIKRTKR